MNDVKIFRAVREQGGKLYSIKDIIEYYIQRKRDINIDGIQIEYIYTQEGNIYIDICIYENSGGFWISDKGYFTNFNNVKFVNYTSSSELEELALKHERIMTIDKLLDI